jgi:hypothetical protein
LIDHFSCLGKKIKIKGCLVFRVHDEDPAASVGRLADPPAGASSLSD